MKEYKFRAWDSRQKKMCFDVNVYSDSDGTWWAADWYGEDLHQISSFDSNQDGGEIMQYTGLKDKNGKEIYESDIVRVQYDQPEFLDNVKVNDIAVIVWDESFCGFGADAANRKFDHCMDIHSCMEVIGNIFEDPDPLK